MKIFFARHGESVANALRIISNRNLPHPLTEKGREQALVVAGKLTGKTVSRIYTSPLLRARQTADIIAAVLACPIEVADGLREYDCGILEGRGDEDAWQIHKQFVQDWLADRNCDLCPEGGETFYDIGQRFSEFVSWLLAEPGNPDREVLCVAHGGVYKFGLPQVLENVDFETVQNLDLGHTMLMETEGRSGGSKLRLV